MIADDIPHFECCDVLDPETLSEFEYGSFYYQCHCGKEWIVEVRENILGVLSYTQTRVNSYLKYGQMSYFKFSVI